MTKNQRHTATLKGVIAKAPDEPIGKAAAFALKKIAHLQEALKRESDYSQRMASALDRMFDRAASDAEFWKARDEVNRLRELPRGKEQD